jgi:hypothetical protein
MYIHVVCALSSLFLKLDIDATNAKNFCVISNSFTPAQRQVGSRWIQFGLRVGF